MSIQDSYHVERERHVEITDEFTANDIRANLRDFMRDAPYILPIHKQSIQTVEPIITDDGHEVKISSSLEDDLYEGTVDISHPAEGSVTLRTNTRLQGFWKPTSVAGAQVYDDKLHSTSNLITHLEDIGVLDEYKIPILSKLLDSPVEPSAIELHEIFEQALRQLGKKATIISEYDMSEFYMQELSNNGEFIKKSDISWETLIRIGSVASIGAGVASESYYMSRIAPTRTNRGVIESTDFVIVDNNSTKVGIKLRGNDRMIPRYIESAVNEEVIMRIQKTLEEANRKLHDQWSSL